MEIPVEISARHLHLSPENLKILFGPEVKLKVAKEISQPGQFAAEQCLRIVGPKGNFEKVRVVGPTREHTQVELSITDCFKLGIEPKIAISGDYDNSLGGVELVGPVGRIKLEKGVIVAQRHLHISPNKAAELGLSHMDIISVKAKGQRSIIFNNVVVRSREGIDEMALHLDTDEANAAGLKPGDTVTLEKK